jgi:hypothetical protein
LPHTSYKLLLLYLNLDTLQVRRVKHDICFLYKLLNGYIYRPDLLSNLSFLVLGHTTRQTDTFYVPFQRTVYSKNVPIIRFMQHVYVAFSITPILKSGNATDVANYRPMSILSHLSKLFENIVLNCIKRSVNNIIIDEQHGFCTGWSTTTCNLVLSNFIFEVIPKTFSGYLHRFLQGF